MITIEEKSTAKLPGLTSLFVSFKYDPKIVDILKSFQSGIYNKDTKEWEFSISYLSKLIDELTLFDDIELDIQKQELKKDMHYELHTYKTKPFEHQIEAIEYGLNHNKWLLLDPPGLGKSATALWLSQELKTQKNIQHCLIICGVNTLKSNWKNEVYKHTDLDCKILGEYISSRGNLRYGGIDKRLEQLKSPIKEFYVVTNIQTIRDSNIVSAIKNGPNKFDMIVVDEIHTCVSGDTLINTDRGIIKIKCINQNDNVLSYNVVSNSLEYKKVLNTFKIPNSKKLLKLTILDDNGFEHNIKCTPEHKIYTHNRGFVEAQFLTCDDRIEIIKN